MARYCDVALPIPVDRVFTYSIANTQPVVGGRVLVPFRREHLQGIVVKLHDAPPDAETRPILRVVDDEPVLSEDLLQLGRWIAEYYIAPVGEVLRTMLPLGAEIQRAILYSITERGATELARPRQKALDEDLDRERGLAVLELLTHGGPARPDTLRKNTSATVSTLQDLLSNRWVERRSSVAAKPIVRGRRVAVLVPEARLPKLNENQQILLAELASADGRLPVSDLRQLSIPRSTLDTLVRRQLVRLEDEPTDSYFDSLDVSNLRGSSTPDENMLNRGQREVLLQIASSVHTRKFQPFLLHGVTGSGKTAVYLAAMRRALDAGLSSLLLVPEIGLTPAMVAHLRSSFGDEVALLHSALTGAERTAQWHRIRRGVAHIVVGTRSAVFAPIANLSLIVVDEEHDTSYKQAELPRYHARDVAVMRAKLSNATIVLGSATPSLESWANVQRGKYTLLSLKERVGRRPLPEVSLIDMRREFAETGQDRLLSRQLSAEIEDTLRRGEQVILLLNRRGYSFVAMCRACGEKLQCDNCAIALTHHKSPADVRGVSPGWTGRERMVCHYCGFSRSVPKHCPNCQSEHVYFFGIGSQQGEERLLEMFPHARIARMDRDTMRSHRDYQRILAQLHSGEINLLVGTQMIAKGHDIHGVTLVGVVGVDHALGLPDFRSAERVFQLLTQVAGRAGRGELPGRVLIQTYHQDHYAVRFAAQHDYSGFVEHELRYRRLLHYPPAAVLANILVEHSDAEKAFRWASRLGKRFQQENQPGVRTLGPAAAPVARIKRIHRFHLVIKASNRRQLAASIRRMLDFADSEDIPRRYITVDVDAMQLM